MKIVITILALIISPISLANVSGERVEIFGSQWRLSSFSHWASRSDALITPEVSSLAIQSCLRDGQRSIDIAAYSVTKRLLGEMRRSFVREKAQSATLAYDVGLDRLTQILLKLDSLPATSAADYSRKCEEAMTQDLRDRGTRTELAPLFRGRMEPKISAALPPKLFAKLGQMSRKGIRLAASHLGQSRQQCLSIGGLLRYFAETRTLEVLLADASNGECLA